MRFLLVGLFFVSLFAKAQSTIAPSKSLKATRISKTPKIDGVLDDEVWQTLPTYGDFQMFEPGNEGTIPEELKSEIKMAYDDKAVYIAAYLFDPNPEAILSQFSQRDEIFVQADNFMVALNTYNDALNETRFWVTSAGTIGDQRVTQNDRDFGFDVVWQCRVSKDEKGWYAEYKIPYNALRFPEVEVQDWSVNFYRRLVRQNETHTWSRIERGVGRDTQYNGTITGVRDIDPPVRLTFFPFAQALTTSLDGETITDFAGGLDIKYGLSDSFTLDAQLIPDFGQVAFDAVRLNLGPFEQTFSENRPFFTEGTDLFEKGRVFFSRRIGNAPTGSVGTLNEDEVVLERPDKVNLLNSIKISGRTKEGLGVGFLNSISEKTFASIRNTETGDTREVLIEPLTNYNVFVLDQQFNGNSSISVINTSVLRNGSGFRDANVTGGVFDVADKGNNFRASGRAIMSNVNRDEGFVTGFQSELDVFKIKGSWRYRVGHDFSNTTFDINDLGLNFRNNFNNFVVGGSYELIQPTETFNAYRIGITARHRRLYDPNVETGNNINVNTFFATKERFAFGGNVSYNTESKDFFEPRVEGRFLLFDPSAGGNAWISTDFRKKFALDLRLNYRNWFNEFDGNEQDRIGVNFSPRYRFSDKFLLVFSTDYRVTKNNFGWVDNTSTDVFIGLRDITSFENVITASYNFDPFKAIDLRLRNFWSTADYGSEVYYLLNTDGTRSLTNYDLNERRDPNTNFNIWNMDLSFRWRFAPGSIATLLYRNQIFNNDAQSAIGYTESLGNLFDQPIQHTVSLRVTYFIDYNNIKGFFKKNS